MTKRLSFNKQEFVTLKGGQTFNEPIIIPIEKKFKYSKSQNPIGHSVSWNID